MAGEVEEKQGDLVDDDIQIDAMDDLPSKAPTRKSPINKQTFIIIAVAVVVGGLLFFFLAKPKYEVLFSGLSTSDAAGISAYLKKQNIDFKISEDGETVSVANSSVPKLRLELASKGMPKGSGVGFEVFDKQNLTVTDFSEKLNYHRALEGELSRTIGSLESVKDARVHLVLAKKSVFRNQDRKASASVVITSNLSQTLSDDQIAGIRHLVASAIPDLDAANVQITDNMGNSLVPFDDAESKIANKQNNNEAKLKKFEKQLENDLITLLDPILGHGNVLVNVTAEMNFDESEMNIETYAPLDAEGKKQAPIVRSEQTVKETYARDGVQVVGVPGTTNNVPSFTGLQVRPTGKDENAYTKEDVTRNYEVSKRIEKVKKASGLLEKLSVAVVVNKDLSQAERATLRQTVSVAAGMNPERGDQVIITGIKFSSSRYTDIEAIRQNKKRREQQHRITVKKYLALFVTLLVGGLVTLVLLGALKRTLANSSNEEIDRLLDEDEVAILSDIDGKIEEAELAYSKKISLDGNRTIAKMKEELEKTIDDNPRAVAKSLENYINDTGAGPV